MEHKPGKRKEGAGNSEPAGDRTLRSVPPPAGSEPSLSRAQALKYLDRIYSVLNEYNRSLDRLKEEDMYEVEKQRDRARECILKVDTIISAYRSSKKG
jgi:hypothetical protein